MNKPIKYSLLELFNSVKIGFTFEFYSSKGIDFIVQELQKITIKKIIVTNISSYEPTYDEAILYKEFESKKPKYKLKINRQYYNSIIPIVKNILNWIKETSECRLDTLMKVNIEFDNKHLQTLNSISTMNPIKLVLGFDESFIYDRFKNQKDSAYCLSIKKLAPVSNIAYLNDIIKNVNYIIDIPKEDFYGINFSKYTQGILEFNYIGGVDYAEKEKEIIEIIEYYIIKTYKSINELEYSNSEISEIKELTNEFYKIQEAYYNPEKFLELYPKIKLKIDIKNNIQFIRTYWERIRSVLFDTVINNNFTEGEFNYDTTDGQYQLRNATINCSNLSNFDLVLCDVSGVVKSSNLISSKIHNARLYDPLIVSNNKIVKSYIERGTIERANTVDNCIINNNNEIINCKITNSLIKYAILGKNSNLDDKTIFIHKESPKIEIPKGVQIEEIRDYKWIKHMSNNSIKNNAYGNEYIKKHYI